MQSIAATITTASVGGGNVRFIPLHTYYISPTGSDRNNGLTTSTAWASPNHNVVCGDVIIAQPGSYRPIGRWGTVSGCPSSSGGIDGIGGIYFAVLLCGGSNVGDCTINSTNASSMDIASSNWAVEGWSSTTSGVWRSYVANACASGTTIIHHVAFINNIAYNSAQGYTTADCALNHNVPGNGVDQFAVVGSIVRMLTKTPFV